MNIYRFQVKVGSLNHPQVMFHDISPKFGTLVYCGMGNNAMQLRFQFVFKRIFFNFFALKEATFCEGGASNTCQRCNQAIFTQTRSYLRDAVQIL